MAGNHSVPARVVPADPRRGGTWFIYVAAGISALSGLLFGYDTGVISGALLFIRERFSLSPGQQEIVVSVVLVGAVIGAVLGGPWSDRSGRRLVIFSVAGIFALGAIGTALAPSVGWLIFGRLWVGVAIGVASFVAPMYIAEISPLEHRGALVALNQLAITVGIVVSYMVDFSLAHVHEGWRWMFGLAVIPAGILATGMIFLPESPRWLLSKGRREKARATLLRIRGATQVDREMAEIEETLKIEEPGWGELLKPTIRLALIIGAGLAMFQQITGINTVIYYGPTIFQQAGFASASAAILATVGVGLVNVLLTIVAILLLDRVGRRPLLLVGLAGMIVGLGAMGLAFQFTAHSQTLAWLAVISLMVYVGSFAIGLGPVFWLLIAEIYPLKVRGRAMSIATLSNWGFNLLVASTFLTLVNSMGQSWTFWTYGLVSVLAWIFCYRLVPETKGHTLEEIETHWITGKPLR